MASELRRQLNGRPDDVVGSSALGVSIESAGDGSPFHWVRWGECPIARTRDPWRAVAALDLVLAEAARPVGGHVRVPARSVVLADGRAVLLPAEAEAHVLRLDRALRAHDAVIVDSRSTVLDPAAGQVVVPDAVLDRPSLVPLLGGDRPSARERTVAAGRHPVAGLLVVGEAGSLGRRLVGAVSAADSLTEPTVTGLVDLFRRLPCRRVSDWRPSVVIDGLAALRSP